MSVPLVPVNVTDPDVTRVLHSRPRWDASELVRYDGTNFRQWNESLTDMFIIRGCKWLLQTSKEYIPPDTDTYTKRAYNAVLEHPKMPLYAPTSVEYSSQESFSATTNDELVFDTGCNYHLTHRLDVLHDYQTSPPGSSVRWGSGDRSPILGFGAILFASEVDREATTIRIPDVALVKGHKTLLGWRKFLQDTECELCATAQDAGLYRGGKLVVPVQINADSLPILHGCALTTSELTSGVAVASDSMLWHARLGHPSPAVVTKLVRQELVPPSGGQPIHPTECDACARGKARRVIRQPPSGPHALAPGEEIHSDIFFPGSATTTGATCALTMVDAYS
jgi:hypothetical protein